VVCESRKNFFAEKYYQENYGDKWNQDYTWVSLYKLPEI
jgi:hypothetical protein